MIPKRLSRLKILGFGLFCTSVLAGNIDARAQSSTTLYGALGLNTVPSARMDPAGTVRLGVSTGDPYVQSFVGFQLAEPLSVVLRQTAEVSNINEEPDRLYPGLDLKLRLLEESAYRPEVSIGLQSAVGHKRSAGEYIALSKRYHDFDFTAGLGWGRYGSVGHFSNPLKIFGGHFDSDRALDGEDPNRPNDWFTGENVGVFGGLEYFTPVDGLSLKADYGADRYTAESAAFGYDAPAPWSLGVNYTPDIRGYRGMDIALGMLGTDKVMARLSFDGNLKNWPTSTPEIKRESPFRSYRTGLNLPAQMEHKAAAENIQLYNTHSGGKSASANLTVQNRGSLPLQIGRAAKHMGNHAGPNVEELTIRPVRMGLSGPEIRLQRAALERTAAHNQGSAAEIWHTADIRPVSAPSFNALNRPASVGYGLNDVTFTLDAQGSLSEEDSTGLYRTSLIVGTQAPQLFGFLDSFFSLRVNVADNLDRLAQIRPRPNLPVRSDIDLFADRTFAVDTAFSSFTHSFRSDLHLSLMGGYLEEQYAGAGGEILYRPYDARWAFGAESFLALKRDPHASMNLGLNGDHLLSAHVQGWYDLPVWDTTLNARVGRYLAEDIGATLALQKRFRNGATLEGYVTVSDQRDFDLFGGTTSSDHGIRLTLPLGGFDYVPDNVNADLRFAPFGRDIGQSVRNPIPLYELTEPFSARHIAQYWDEITP